MSGLLGAIDGLTVSADLSTTLQPQANALGSVSGAVDGLAQGPQALLNMEASIGAMPVAPALNGLGNLAPSLSTTLTAIPSDFSATLSGLTNPLLTLKGTLSASPAGRLMCMLEVLRETIKLAGGKDFGGPLGMPDGTGFRLQDMVDLAEIETAIADADAAVDGLGPVLDAARVLRFLQEIASKFDRVLVRFPPIPVVQDLTEALGTVARWQTLSGTDLTAHLAETISTAARVIDLPHDRVVRDTVAAADQVAAGPTMLGEVNADLAALFADLRGLVEAGAARPAEAQLARLEAAVARVETLAHAMDPDRSPLGHSEDLVCNLLEARLLTLRTLQPQCGPLPFGASLQAWLDGLPAAQLNVFADIVQEINDFDLSALTDPLETIQQAAQDAVDAFNDAREAVRDQLTALLQPVANGLDSAIDAAQLDGIQAALDALPAQIQQFVDDEIVANLDAVRTGISAAVGQISTLADDFDPDSLAAPIRDAIQQVGGLVNNPDVQGTFQEVENALNETIQAIGSFDLAPAADESIDLIAGIDTELSKIDPNDIPDAVKPLIEQGVAVVADINFSAEVSAPLEAGIQQAVEAGPNVVLRAIEEGMDQARVRIEGFRPSVIIADTLDQPFEAALGKLEVVSPDALFGRIETALEGVQSRVQILDVGAVVDPLVEVHGRLTTEIGRLRPSNLLKPVDDAIAAAIDKIYEVSGLDTAFDGINGVLEEINRYAGLIASVRDLLAKVAGMLAAPGDAGAQLDAVVDDAVAALDAVDLGGLAEAFARASQAVQRNERDSIAGTIARSYRAAGRTGAGLGSHAEVARLNRLVAVFPLQAARGLRPGRARQRLIAGLHRLGAAAGTLPASTGPWATLGPALEEKAGSIQVDLKDYYLIGRVEDQSVLEGFATPPATTDALKAEVRAALNDGVGPPVRMVLATFSAIAPHAQVVVQGLSDILGAVHTKVDSITGADGVGGTVQDVETVVNLLREVDLSPVTDPLDALFGRIEGAVNAISPAALRTPLEAARDAIAGLIDLSLLIDPADRAMLDAAYGTVVAKLRALSPSKTIGEPLDAEYEELLATILPILDLPGRLRMQLLEAGLNLSGEITVELARVETAFDEMLRAIPVRTGVSVSASASVSVSV